MAEYPNYNYTYQQTFWAYSDNEEAALTLAPWNKTISESINHTIMNYHLPASRKFEVLEGKQIGFEQSPTDRIINSSSTFAVLIRIHNGAFTGNDWNFADPAIYHALSLYYQGNLNDAHAWLNRAYSFWNGTCVADQGVQPVRLDGHNAPTDGGFCNTFKAALLLFGIQVIGGNYPEVSNIEQYMWSGQQANGGITTLYRNGKFIGSANTETTSLILLNYNQALVTHLRNNVATIPEYPSAQILILAATLTTIAPILLIHRRRKTK
jgi:hypothetical protein